MHEPAPSPRITRSEPVSGAPDRVELHLDDGTTLEAARDVVLDGGLSVGDPVDARLRTELADADLRWRAREAALALLSHRPRSRSELAGRLARRDLPGHVVRSCLDELEERGLVDDAAFARAWVRDRLKLRPRGRAALLAELRGKGVESRVAEAAVDDVFREGDVHEGELAEEVALGWLRRQGPRTLQGLGAPRFSDERERARRRLTAYLRRRGFRGRTLRRGTDAVDAAVGPG